MLFKFVTWEICHNWNGITLKQVHWSYFNLGALPSECLDGLDYHLITFVPAFKESSTAVRQTNSFGQQVDSVWQWGMGDCACQYQLEAEGWMVPSCYATWDIFPDRLIGSRQIKVHTLGETEWERQRLAKRNKTSKGAPTPSPFTT